MSDDLQERVEDGGDTGGTANGDPSSTPGEGAPLELQITWPVLDSDRF